MQSWVYKDPLRTYECKFPPTKPQRSNHEASDNFEVLSSNESESYPNGPTFSNLARTQRLWAYGVFIVTVVRYETYLSHDRAQTTAAARQDSHKGDRDDSVDTVLPPVAWEDH